MDLDGDLRDDLVLSNDSIGIFFTIKPSNLDYFTNSSALGYSGGIVCISTGDYDNDGLTDAASGAENSNGKTHLFHKEGSGLNFKDRSDLLNSNMFIESGSISWVDYNADGYLDLVTVRPSGGTNHLIRNNAGVDFSLESTWTQGHGNGQAWVDYDNDGDQDWLYLMDDSLVLQQNDGTGSFTNVSSTAFNGITSHQLMGGSWGDYDNDGWTCSLPPSPETTCSFTTTVTAPLARCPTPVTYSPANDLHGAVPGPTMTTTVIWICSLPITTPIPTHSSHKKIPFTTTMVMAHSAQPFSPHLIPLRRNHGLQPHVHGEI